MHTFKANKGTVFIYNSDFSGNIIINKSGVVGKEGKEVEEVEEGKEGKEVEEIEIPGSDILEFVAYCYVLGKKIEKLEEAAYEELLTGEKEGVNK